MVQPAHHSALEDCGTVCYGALYLVGLLGSTDGKGFHLRSTPSSGGGASEVEKENGGNRKFWGRQRELGTSAHVRLAFVSSCALARISSDSDLSTQAGQGVGSPEVPFACDAPAMPLQVPLLLAASQGTWWFPGNRVRAVITRVDTHSRMGRIIESC